MKTQQVSTGALIVRDDKKFLIVERSLQDDFMPGFWELPGGGSDYGETPQQAIKREIKEECGLDVNVHVPLTTGVYFMKETQRIEIVYFCTVRSDQKVTLSNEHSLFAWVSFKDISNYEMDEFMKNMLRESTADFDYWTQKYLQ